MRNPCGHAKDSNLPILSSDYPPSLEQSPAQRFGNAWFVIMASSSPAADGIGVAHSLAQGLCQKESAAIVKPIKNQRPHFQEFHTLAHLVEN